MPNTQQSLVVTSEPDLTRDEARAHTDKAKAGLADAANHLIQVLMRNGIKVLGYESLMEFRDAEFSDISRSHIFRLATAASVSEVVGTVVKERHARVLAVLPENLQAEAYHQAEALAGEKPVTLDTLKTVVEELKQTVPAEDLNGTKRVTGRVVSSNGSSTPDDEAKDRETKRDKWDRCLGVLRQVLGVKLAKALEAGTFEHLKDGDVILWVEDEQHKRTTDEIQQIERLVTGSERCTVRQALSILNDMPTDKTRLSHMHNLAIAGNDATLANVGGASHASISASAPKWAHKELDALIRKIQDR